MPLRSSGRIIRTLLPVIATASESSHGILILNGNKITIFQNLIGVENTNIPENLQFQMDSTQWNDTNIPSQNEQKLALILLFSKFYKRHKCVEINNLSDSETINFVRIGKTNDVSKLWFVSLRISNGNPGPTAVPWPSRQNTIGLHKILGKSRNNRNCWNYWEVALRKAWIFIPECPNTTRVFVLMTVNMLSMSATVSGNTQHHEKFWNKSFKLETIKTQFKVDVKISWVKSHAGIAGNEKLINSQTVFTKLVSKLSKVGVPLETAITESKQLLLLIAKKWNHSLNGRHFTNFQRSGRPTDHNMKDLNLKFSLISRKQTGHCGLNQYFYSRS